MFNSLSKSGRLGCVLVSWMPYKQFFSVHGRKNGYLLKLACGLLMDKTQVGYQRLFDVLHAKMMNAGLLWAPQFFISDFEPAILNSARIAFPGITILGCYFHFCQCLWRQVQVLGLAGTFRQNRPVRHTIKLLMALGYLPLSFVKIQFNNLFVKIFVFVKIFHFCQDFPFLSKF